jgi:hypothetical protein
MQPELRISQAFLQLRFAIKLVRYFEYGFVKKEVFDCEHAIPTRGGLLQLESQEFFTNDDLVMAAGNVYSTTLGVCAIALESALADSGLRNDPSDLSPEGQLRSLVYQIRNAFAHDAMTPRWSARGAYAREYDLRSFGIPDPINLAMLNGQFLELEQFGGIHGFEAIRDAVLQLSCASQQQA